MEKSYSESYAAAGVDITAGYRSVELMKQYVARTMNEHCIGGLGGFGGLFELDCTGYKHPVLISGTDGVGTKLKIAMIMDKHDTIGIDCVAMCVNDVICAGAKPLVFLDYIACGRNIPEKIAEIVKGVAEGCVQADCSLVGGETAEHPGMMPEEEYDLAGFTVGVVDKEKILSNETMAAGDVIIACLPPVCTPTVSRWCARSLTLTQTPMCCTPRPPSWAARPWARPCWLPPRSTSSLCSRCWKRWM